VALSNLIQPRCLSIGRFSAPYSFVKCDGDLPSQSYGVGSLLGGDVGEAAICLCELVDGLGGIEICAIQVADEAQRTQQLLDYVSISQRPGGYMGIRRTLGKYSQ